MEERRQEFEARGVRLVAISVDPPELTREHARRMGFSYTFLSDQQGEVLRRYDLLHEAGGPDGHDISRPAEFLIDPTGTVRWGNLTSDYRVRARPEDILEVIDALRAS